MSYRKYQNERVKNQTINNTLINQVVDTLNQYERGIDRKDPGYMYREDSCNRPIIYTKLLTNKLVYILEILGQPDSDNRQGFNEDR